MIDKKQTFLLSLADTKKTLFQLIENNDPIELEKFIQKNPRLDLNRCAEPCGYKDTPFHIVCCKGLMKSAHILLKYGASFTLPNGKGNFPLHLAAMFGFNELIIFLLKRNADIDIVNSYGDTPLLRAAFNNQLDTVKLLVNSGANVYATNLNGHTSLHEAAVQAANPTLVKYFLKKGVPIFSQNLNGDTALHLAAFAGHEEVVQILLEKGADPFLRNQRAKTAYDLASNEIRQIILSFFPEPYNIKNNTPNKKQSKNKDNNNNNNNNKNNDKPKKNLQKGRFKKDKDIFKKDKLSKDTQKKKSLKPYKTDDTSKKASKENILNYYQKPSLNKENLNYFTKDELYLTDDEFSTVNLIDKNESNIENENFQKLNVTSSNRNSFKNEKTNLKNENIEEISDQLLTPNDLMNLEYKFENQETLSNEEKSKNLNLQNSTHENTLPEFLSFSQSPLSYPENSSLFDQKTIDHILRNSSFPTHNKPQNLFRFDSPPNSPFYFEQTERKLRYLFRCAQRQKNPSIDEEILNQLEKKFFDEKE